MSEIIVEEVNLEDQKYFKSLVLYHYIGGGLLLLVGVGTLIFHPSAYEKCLEFLFVIAPAYEELPQVALDSIIWTVLSVCILFAFIGGLLNIWCAFVLPKFRRRAVVVMTSIYNVGSLSLLTVLGVFTFVFLARSSVKSLYASKKG